MIFLPSQRAKQLAELEELIDSVIQNTDDNDEDDWELFDEDFENTDIYNNDENDEIGDWMISEKEGSESETDSGFELQWDPSDPNYLMS